MFILKIDNKNWTLYDDDLEMGTGDFILCIVYSITCTN